MSGCPMFTCAYCGEVFTKKWSDEDANVEAMQLWNVQNAVNDPDMEIVCDDCFSKFIAWWEQARSARCR